MVETSARARPGSRVGSEEIGDAELRGCVDQILNRHACVGLAVGVVRHSRLDFFHGHGLADVASRTPVTEDTVFRIASITKTFTAVAVLQLVEQGRIDLDAPAAEYLRSYRLVPRDAGWRPPSVRHLLTHTAGVPQLARLDRALRAMVERKGLTRLTDSGASYALDERLPSLAEYFRGALPLEAEPGTLYTYGDNGFASLGQIVEDASGLPFDRYLRERVFEPLGMADSDLLRAERLEPRRATGYLLGARGPEAVADRQWVTAGASNIYSTPRDMARYLAALVGRGRGEHGTLLAPDTTGLLFRPHYSGDPRLPGIGLGFLLGSLDGHLTAEHQGIIPGFDSQVYLAPEDGVAVMAFTNGAREGTTWLPQEMSTLLRRLLGLPEDALRTDVPQRPETWAELCGWYPLSAGLTDLQARSVVGLGVEVGVRGGRLHLRALSPIPAMYRGFELHPDDPSDPEVFRVDLGRHGLGTVRIVFRRDPLGRTRVQSDWIPLSLERRPDASSPRRLILSGAAAAGGIGLAALARATLSRSARAQHGDRASAG